MNALIEEHLDELGELCRRYHVDRLELFGSAATERFDPETSDVDLLVTFADCTDFTGLRQYMGFLFDCESLFGRRVDLVEAPAIRNPYFQQEMEKSRTLLYAE